jgi:hypothetical protein
VKRTGFADTDHQLNSTQQYSAKKSDEPIVVESSVSGKIPDEAVKNIDDSSDDDDDDAFLRDGDSDAVDSIVCL